MLNGVVDPYTMRSYSCDNSVYLKSTGCWLAVWVPTAQGTVEVQTVDGSENSTALWTFIRHYAELHADERPALEHDVAWLTLNVSTGFDLQVWAQSHQCWKVGGTRAR